MNGIKHNWGHLDKVDQSEYRTVTTIHSKKVSCCQSAASKKNNELLKAQNLNIDSRHFSRKQNVSPVNVFLFETLHKIPRGHICLTQDVILSTTSNFFATIAMFCNKHPTLNQKLTNVYISP